MGAPNLRLVTTEAIELDAPDAGLEQTMRSIAADLEQVSIVKRDVRSWALVGAASSSLVTVAAISGLFFAFMPGPPPPAIVIQPTPVAVVVSPPPAKPAKVEEPVAEVSEVELGVRRAFSALWAGKPKLALSEAEAVLASKPQNVDALAAQGLALYDLHRDRAARASVKKALKLEPGHPLANVLRGTMAQVEHDVPSALAHYDRYLKHRPSGALAEELLAVRQNISTK